MGRKKQVGAETSEIIPLQTDANGNIRYDLVLHQGSNTKNKVIHSTRGAMAEKDVEDGILKPGMDVVQEVTEKTRLALEKLVDGMFRVSVFKMT